MERDEGRGVSASRQSRGDDWQLAVSSRRRALERLRNSVENGQAGPVLLTGEPGAGKTWQARRLAELLPDDWRTLFVDLAAAIDAIEFLRLIGHGLGVSVTNRLGAARLIVQGVLEDEANDGRRWLLVVDEAHRGSASVWDEIQAIINQLCRPGGFAALVVLGQTELARALATRSLGALAARLSLHLHLMPLDFDEARDLLGYTARHASAEDLALEELHRDARGNPAKLIRLAHSRPGLPPPDAVREERRRHAQKVLPAARLARAGTTPSLDDDQPFADLAGSEPNTATNGPDAVPLIPTKPPLRDEDGLVEVGWEGDLESELELAGGSSGNQLSLAEDQSLNEELIEDRYAALQAWAEWTRNQDRLAGEGTGNESVQPDAPSPRAAVLASNSGKDLADVVDPLDSVDTVPAAGGADPNSLADAADAGRAVASPPSGFRAEGQHEFAPYSHLFNRLRAKG